MGGSGLSAANGEDGSIGDGLCRLLLCDPFWLILTEFGLPSWLRKFFVKSVALSEAPAEFSLSVLVQSFLFQSFVPFC